MSTEEYAALGALAVLFLIVAWTVRRGPRRIRRRRGARLPADFFPRFEARALAIASLVMDDAIARLTELRARLAPGQDVVRAQLRWVKTLACKLDELRASAVGDETRHHEWDYLAATTLDRFPLFSPWITQLDQPTLERASRGEAEFVEATSLLVDDALSLITKARSLVNERPALLWTQLDLVVLTILLLDLDDRTQEAVTRRLDLRPQDPKAAQLFRAALGVAFDLLHATPRAERVLHDDLLVPPLADRDLGAALVRHRIHQAGGQDELVRARALLLGDPELLWLALAVVEKTEYPEQAAAVYGKLAALARRLLRREGDDEETEARLEKAAREVFDTEAAAALVETTRQLRSGRHPEELFAAVSIDSDGTA